MGWDYNNPSDFLTSLNPKTAVMTGPSSWFNTRMRACIPNTNVYSMMSDSAAVVADFSFYGIATEYVKTESEWVLLDGTYYYFDSNGRVTTGWGYIGNAWYYFDEKGEMQCGWQKIGGSWYFFEVSGAMDHDMWIQGVCYLKSSGAMDVSEWVDYNRYYVDERGIWAP